MNQAKNLDVRYGDVPGLESLVKAHPHIATAQPGATHALEFSQSGRNRTISIGCDPRSLLGIVEVVDNNPLVCADEVWLPWPSSTLAVLALMPWIRSGMLKDVRALTIDSPKEEQQALRCMKAIGVHGDLKVNTPVNDHQETLQVVAHLLPTMRLSQEDIEEVFEGIYGNSFFVRSVPIDHHTHTVRNTALAAYCCEVNEIKGNQELTVTITSDRNGKCGATQIVHTMNLMAGFEESLGIGTNLRR